jgi:hypothetical protein
VIFNDMAPRLGTYGAYQRLDVTGQIGFAGH